MNNNNVPTDNKKINSLFELAEEIEKDISSISSEIMPLQKKLEAAKEKLDLVQRLIHLTNTENIDQMGDTKNKVNSLIVEKFPEIEDHIEKILGEYEKPMHISNIRSALIKKGVPLPGRGDEANIILRLRRAGDKFIRTERGMYALKIWNLPEYQPTPHKKKVRRRTKK